MRQFGNILLAVSVSLSAVEIAAGRDGAADYPIRPVPAHHVRFNDAFWQPRLEVNRTVTIPYSFQTCEETGRIENFKVAAGTSDKKWTGRFGFNDSDVSKIIEGASYSLMTHPDAQARGVRRRDRSATWRPRRKTTAISYTAWTARDKIDNPGQHHLLLSEGAEMARRVDEPRAVQPGPHVRSGGGPLRGDGREEFSRRGHEERGLAGEDIRPRQDGGAARASGDRARAW